jgi:hypothetical protein
MSGSGVENIQLLRELGLRGRALRTGWELPNDLSEAEWRLAGERLGKVEHGIPWWIGDWWVFGKHKYGDRKAIVKSTDWKGPTYTLAVHAQQ